MKTKNKHTLQWLHKHSKKYYPYIIAHCFCSTVISVSYVFLALLSKAVIDIASGTMKGDIMFNCTMLFVIIITQVVLSVVNSRLVIKAEGRLSMSLKRHLYDSILNKKFTAVKNYHSGDLLNRLSSDVQVIVGSVATLVPNIVSLITKIIACTVTIYLISPSLTLIVLAVGIIAPLAGRILSSHFKYLHKEAQQSDGEIKSFLQESFENITVIKTFTSDKPVKEKLDRSLKNNFSVLLKRNYLQILSSTGVYSVFTLGYYALLVWGAFNIGNGITYGTLIAFLEIVTQIRAPLQRISGILPQYYSMIASAERIIEIENADDEVRSHDGGDISFESITAKNLTFRYEEDDEDVIINADFTIKKGGITAILGPSGSGKSTLFKLLLGLLEPTDGRILINGKPSEETDRHHLFAYVPQGSMILSGTIRENLTLCREGITEEELVSATKIAEIYDYIVSLPDGFDTMMRERGAGLSEGQVQRLSIARALLCNNPVLLLDESTSALDDETESRVLSNIKKLSDKTVIFITHRKRCIKSCDRVLEFRDKQFAEKEL